MAGDTARAGGERRRLRLVDGDAPGREPAGLAVPRALRPAPPPRAGAAPAVDRRAAAEGTGEAGAGARRSDLVIAAPDARRGHRRAGGPGLRLRPLHSARELLGASGDVG